MTGTSIARVLAILGAAFALGAAASPAGAQTAEQLSIFRSLPPAQQQEILQQIGSRPSGFPAPAAPPVTDESAGNPVGGVASPIETPIPAELQLRAGDTLLISVTISADADRAQTEYRRRLLDGNPYQLDRMGRLVLQGATPVVLAGLNVEEAALRLNADPQFRGYTMELQLLPVEPELRPFGYDLFRMVPTTFAPSTDIPVPVDYVIGPGDNLDVQLIGESGGRFLLTVGRDGAVDFPEIGPIAVAGMRFAAAKTMLEQRVAEQLIGMRASVSMGELRSIQIFVLGEAERPGSYTVGGLSTMTNALFASGGVKAIGSLRNIELKRDGKLVRRLDLYDLLLKGDTSNDSRLLPGDVIFIPPVGATVAISGEIQRPAIYEVPEGATASELLQLSGGLTPAADPRTGRLERIDERRNRMVVDIDLTSPQGRGTKLQTGDVIRIQGIRDSVEGAVSLDGHVHRVGSVQFRQGMRLTDLIGSLDELKPQADLHYALIRRETGPARRVSVLSADLAAAFADPRSPANVALESRDHVFVFDLAGSRDRITVPIIDELDRQSDRDEPRQVVGVGGHVKVPGQYPLEPGMKISDLLRAGGSLDQAAYGGSAELTRYQIIGGERRQTELIEIDLGRVKSGDAAADVALLPFDYLMIREVPEWGEQETVTIAGEVRFPGTYPIKRGESLRSVIQRAGGLTSLAFAEGSVFTREDLQKREQHQLEVLADRLQRDIASLSLQQSQTSDSGNAAQAMAAGRQLLSDLRATQAVGRLVIRLDAVMAAAQGSEADIVLRNGDRLVIPRLTQEVTVIGEVQSPTSHLFQTGLSRNDYIARSGGTTQRADKKRVFVIRANGEVAPASTAGWFNRSGNLDIRPGDTVVVPYDAEQVRPLTMWTSITQILYNIAVAVAAVNSF